jgi:hypothetical protein
MANLGLSYSTIVPQKSYLQINEGLAFADFPGTAPRNLGTTGPGWVCFGASKAELTVTQDWDFQFKVRPQRPTIASNFIVPRDGIYNINAGVTAVFRSPQEAGVLQQYCVTVAANFPNDGFSNVDGTFIGGPLDGEEPFYSQRKHVADTAFFTVASADFARPAATYQTQESAGLHASATTYLKKGTVLTFAAYAHGTAQIRTEWRDFYASIDFERDCINRFYQGQLVYGRDELLDVTKKPLVTNAVTQTY